MEYDIKLKGKRGTIETKGELTVKSSKKALKEYKAWKLKSIDMDKVKKIYPDTKKLY